LPLRVWFDYHFCQESKGSMAQKSKPLTKAQAELKKMTKHWRVKDVQFDTEGRIIIDHPKLAAIVKRHVKRGKHFYLSSTNTGNYCVVISSCFCGDVEKI